MKKAFRFIRDIVSHFLDSNTFQKGAALAYYAVFSLLPIIMIISSLLGLLFGEKAVTGEIYNQLKGTLGTEAAIQIQDLIKNQNVNHNSAISTIIGFVVLALSASGMFTQIHSAFNHIWNIKAKPKSSILSYFSKHFSSFVILILLFFILFSSTAINSFLLHHAEGLSSQYQLAYAYEHVVSFLVIGVAFSVMFKFLGDAIVHWKIALLGGMVTALLFTFGKIGIAKYIAHSHVSSTFGSASVLALLMLWVYYISQIIFLGASFIEIISNRLGYQIKPNHNAIKIEIVEVEK